MIKHLHKSFLFLFVVVFLFACDSQKKLIKNIPCQSIQVETTPCFGTCPVYKLTISGNRDMKFEGTKFTKMDGNWSARLEQEEVNDLFLKLHQADLFKFEDNYPTQYSDLPTTHITYNNGKKVKRIAITGEHPKELDQILLLIQQAKDKAVWINGNLE